MTTLDDYLHAGAAFDSVVAALPARRWDEPCTSTDWSRREVLRHVVRGQELLLYLATEQPCPTQAGAPGALQPDSLAPTDALGMWRAAHATSTLLLTRTALAQTVDLGTRGTVSLRDFLPVLTADLLVHARDIDPKVRLDPELVDRQAPDRLPPVSVRRCRSRRASGRVPARTPAGACRLPR